MVQLGVLNCKLNSAQLDMVCECVAHLKKNSLQAGTAARTSGVFEGLRRYCGIIPDYTGSHTNEISLKPLQFRNEEIRLKSCFTALALSAKSFQIESR